MKNTRNIIIVILAVCATAVGVAFLSSSNAAVIDSENKTKNQ